MLLAFCVFLLSTKKALAKPVDKIKAEKVVNGWLGMNSTPMGMELRRELKKVETFSDSNGLELYYVVYLKPSGFVIVSADDDVEPIIAFSQGENYEISPENHLSILISNDLPYRISETRKHIKKVKGESKDKFSNEELRFEKAIEKSNKKWTKLFGRYKSKKNIQSLALECKPNLSRKKINEVFDSYLKEAKGGTNEFGIIID